MNRTIKIAGVLVLCVALQACVSNANTQALPAQQEPIYDAALAAQLGADDYGMRSYIFVTLMTGPNDAVITDTQQRSDLFRGHFANMSKMAEAGQLVLAGPLDDAAGIKRGIFILNVDNVEAAKALVENDPAFAAGIFTADYIPYYGSAALMQINQTHKRLQKIAIE